MTAAALLASSLFVAGCASAPSPEPSPLRAEASLPVADTTGQALDAAWEALTEAGLRVEASDIREDRSIWDRSNWVVVSQVVEGERVALSVEKFADPVCWEKATTCEWAVVYEFSSTGDAESGQFELDGGPARLTYSVAAGLTTEGKRVADIYFQDIAMHHESSSIDTIINVDGPGSAPFDLGPREGTYFLMTEVREGDVSDVSINVVVEQMRPAGP